MADRIVGVVKFFESVTFAGTEARSLAVGLKGCTAIKRVSGGIEAESLKGGIFVPDSNIVSVTFPAEQPKATGRV
jgi:hypothetical protein